MKNMLLQNTLRSVKKAPGRFAAIAAIIALSCAFYSGVKAACPDMKNSAWKYYEEQALADIQLKSTLGFNEGDCEKLLENEEFTSGYAGYSADLFTESEQGNAVVKVMSYSEDYPLNKLYLTEGRLPEKPGECVADSAPRDKLSFKVGDKITLSAENNDETSDYLSQTEFTIVGLAQSPLYVNFERGSTTVGTGNISAFMYIPEEDFALDAYTDIYLSVGKAHQKGVAPFSDEYEDIVEEGEYLAETLADSFLAQREEDIRAEADESLAEAREKLADGEKKLADGNTEYQKGLRDYNSAYDELKAQREDLDSAMAEYNDGLKLLDENQAKIQELYDTCPRVDNILKSHKDVYMKVLPEELLSVLKDIQRIYDDNDVEASISDLLAVYIITDPERDPNSKAAAGAAITGANEQVKAAASAALTEIDNQRKALEESGKQFEEAETALADFEKELADAKHDLDDAQKELSDAQTQIDDANKEISDAENDLDEMLEDKKWYVWNRGEWSPDCLTYGDDAERIDSIAAVFPLFFILIAALVCCTTMSRMVEEQRTETGTMKALGFGSGAIISQYVLYASFASIIGSVIGTVIGFPLLPTIIFKCYRTMYNFPIFEAPFMPLFALGCCGVSLLCTGLSAVYTSYVELTSVPAALIRPKPPKGGKRIFLEKIGFIWKRLKFTSKVTFRNLFRYKSRFFMTLIGISGSTALLLTGFALKQSISCIADKQYDEIFLYDATVILSDKASDEELAEADRVISENEAVTSSMKAIMTVKDIYGDDNNSVEASLLVPEKTEELGGYIVLKDRSYKSPLTLEDGSVILTEKLSILLNVKTGDTVFIEGSEKPVKVAAIAENYTYHFVYMTSATYNELFGEGTVNTILLNTSENADQDEISSELISCDAVISAAFTVNGTDKFRKLISSLDLIVAVIVIFAGALAVVILYNLANININERVRELATIKVLGFFDGEVGAYVYRENTVSTIIGIILGLFVGIFFEHFVIVTAEVDEVMFSRDIPWFCYVLAAASMAVFTVFVNLLLYFKLKKIDMASSMKAIE
ncbi:MAG: FtsX-like permease family protein [Huintestinicola sp.]|uniref:FtsX-like permease family protein n=1 Tax=Huintestinicola sp. TaxID=2981661 RepID=UPI003F0E9C50